MDRLWTCGAILLLGLLLMPAIYTAGLWLWIVLALLPGAGG